MTAGATGGIATFDCICHMTFISNAHGVTDMSFVNAIAAAPEGIDFISYKDDLGTWVIVRRIGNEHRVIAQLDDMAYPIFVAGVAARHMSLWSYESRVYIVGDVGQLDREEA